MNGSKWLVSGAAIAGAAAMIGLAGSAGAVTAGADLPTVVVHYSESMLSTETGVHQLYRRLNEAAEKVCPESGANHFASLETMACRKAAVARAVEKIDNPHLAALQASRAKRG